ncbi:MAG: 5'-3' exonuclease [Acidimicrobiales bacterium]
MDGTYELFRHYYATIGAGGRRSAAPSPGHPRNPPAPPTRAAVRGVVASILGMLETGTTHIGVASDHVIESFRNALWPSYKTGAGVPSELMAQVPVMEDCLEAIGVTVWRMVELEADDALASAAAVAAETPEVRQVVIATPDKDLAQCVVGDRVVQLDRRRSVFTDEEGVVSRFGVHPASIPDYLALVGDAADGFPGLPGFGPKSAAAVLSRYRHLERVPAEPSSWDVKVAGRQRLAATLAGQLERAQLFRRLATLVVDRSLLASVAELRWRGPRAGAARACLAIGAPRLAERAHALAESRG